MTEKREIQLDVDLEIRETSTDGAIGYIYGRAVPYGDPTMIGGVREQFAAGAFDEGDVIGKPLNWRHNEPIGVIRSAESKPDGLYIGADILDTALGRDAATLTRGSAVKGLSVGFMPTDSEWDSTRTSVTHNRASLAEVSLTPMPAYANAGVSVVREGVPMSETAAVETTEVPAMTEDREAREQIAQLRERLESVSVRTTEPAHPLAQYRSLQEYAKAIATDKVDGRALDVSILSEQTGLVPPTWLSDIKGVLDRGRPCINAIGGPIGAGDSGLSISWPTFSGDLSAIVATNTEGSEPNSAEIKIVSGTATLAQYDAGNRLTWQVIDRTSPSYVEAHARILMGAYGTETDYAFQAGMWANDVVATGVDYVSGSDTDGSDFLAAVWQAATDVEFATGQPAEVVYVSTAIWALLPTWSRFQDQNYPIQNVAGGFNLRGMTANIGGLPIVPAREFATDGTEDAIVTNRAAIGWAEAGPNMVSADVPSSGGRDVAIYGLGVVTPFIPNGIRSIYNVA